MKKLASLKNKNLVIEAIEKNFLEKFIYFISRIQGMEVVKINNIFLSNSNLRSDTFNTAIGGNVKEDNFNKYAKEVRDYFTDKNLPMAWWCGPSSLIGKDNQILLELGFVNEEMDVCMAADLENISTGFLSENSDLDIREAVSKAQIRDFSYALALVFEPFDDNVIKFYETIAVETSQLYKNMKLYVGYYKDEPVTSSCCFFDGCTAGVYDIATVPSFRGRGFGSYMTFHTLLESKKNGYKIAVLGASDKGLSIYEKLGFESFGNFYVYSNKNLVNFS
jgi:GNAT superfamily N-acetyltransferase